MTLTLAPETEARLRAAADQKGLAPEDIIDALLRQDGHEMPLTVSEVPTIKDTSEQARMRAAFFNVVAKAQAIEFEQKNNNPEQAEEERLFDEIIAEKYRKQGFNLP